MAILMIIMILVVWGSIGIASSVQRKGKPIEKAEKYYTPEEIEKFCNHIVLDFDNAQERRRYLRSR